MIIDCHNHVGVDLMFYLRGDFPYAQHLVTMTSEGRALGVDRWIVFPFVVPIAFRIEALQRGEIVFDGTGLEKVPYRFLYVYGCDDPACPGHRQTIVDWEIGQLYRALRDRGDADDVALRKICDKWLGQMCAPDRDTAFFVGNHLKNPRGFMVLGVFWPPKR